MVTSVKVGLLIKYVFPIFSFSFQTPTGSQSLQLFSVWCVCKQVCETVCLKCCHTWVSCCSFQSTVLKLEGFLQTSALPEHRDLCKWLLNSHSKPRSRCGDSRLWFLAWPLLLLLKSWIEGCSDRTGLKCGLTKTALCYDVPLSNGPATLREGLMVVWWGKKHVPLKLAYFWICWSNTGPKSHMLISFSVSQNIVKLLCSIFIWLWGFISASTLCCGNITAWWCWTQRLFLLSWSVTAIYRSTVKIH